MSLDIQGEVLSDKDALIGKYIKDLETGDQYPYLCVKNAAYILKRIAKHDGCSVDQALETLWIFGCDAEELRQIRDMATRRNKN